ncbi:uncharacterized protein LOC111243227 [Varroa destructor]|uniref:Uncharacterized protein n=1 Tax=Varroa destructor TaxID=109461 RepID=A0A7M7J7I6_VARDE|nr:uncharacterized protein LOC111243227 [Varroa destructor]
MEYKNVTDNSGSGPVDDSGLPFVLMPVVDNGNKFARSDQREENVSSNYHTQGNVTENVESERSLTPDDLFDNIPSPKMLNDSDAHRRNNVSQAHHDPTNTGASAKQRTQKSAGRKRKKIASQISDATQLSANNNLVTHKRRTRSVEKSSVNTKRATGLMPVPNCNTATITSVGLSPSAGGLEIDLTHPVSSNGADKPPRKLGSTKFRQPYARLVTEGGNTSFESKTPTNLDTLLASFSFPLQTQGNENALQISRAAVLQRILNLIQDSEEFCNN